jgi:hypothetical protein
VSHAVIALRSYLVPLVAARALKLVVLLLVGVLGLAGISLMLSPLSDFFARESLDGLRRAVVFPGLPILAILMSEIPLRDGIRHRTLLYPLLGPVSRFTLAWVRTLATGVVLALLLTLVISVIRLLAKHTEISWERELLAIGFGAPAYIALYGLVHMLVRRGLIAGLGILMLFDGPLSQMPFALRMLAPSYHVNVLADQVIDFKLPVPIPAPEPSIPVSIAVLVGMTVVLTLGVGIVFGKKDLGELC